MSARWSSMVRMAGWSAAALALGATTALWAAGVHFARRVLTPTGPDSGVTVRSLEARPSGTDEKQHPGEGELIVWLCGPDADLQGNYSFIFDGGEGHVRVGPVIDRVSEAGVDRVARRVLAVDRGDLRPGAMGRITGWWYTDPRELGYRVEDVRIPLDGGAADAWLVRPDTAAPGRWAIHIHGRGAQPEETLRGLAPLARAGVTSLVIRYRNDAGAPSGIGGRYGLGLAERYDVDAAIAWAIAHGAARVTLVGWSMGGTAALLSATRGPHRGIVDGIVLDSPGIDWDTILREHARLAQAPAPTASVGMWLLRRGWVRGAVPWERGTDLHALSAEAFASRLRVPVLIHASPGDTFVPWNGSVRLSAFRPELVRLREAPGEHVKLWNVEPSAWERETEAFVRNLGDPPGATSTVRPPSSNA